ncbi:MAG: hypothetical protein ACFFDY_00045 [Candidatus Thorarchaeota archaeon]
MRNKRELLGDNNPSKRLEVRQKISEKKKGENHHNCKLTQMIVDWIRNILNSQEYKEAKSKRLMSQKQLAELFGVSEMTISDIKLNKAWLNNHNQ